MLLQIVGMNEILSTIRYNIMRRGTMKKLLSVIMIPILLTVFATASYSEIDKLNNHWSKGIIDMEFVGEYFDYLTKDDYKNFSPDSTITVGEFISSVSKLFCDHDVCIDYLKIEEPLTRREMSRIVGKILIDKKLIESTEEKTPFMDISSLSKEELMIISSLYKNDIIKGNSRNEFSPERNATQAECIITLQRVKGVLKPMGNNAIPFKVKSKKQVYNGVHEGLEVNETLDSVEISVVVMYPTPGYSLNVDRIFKNNDGEYEVYLTEKPPKEGSILPQVITYKVLIIEIDKSNLGEKPYVFQTIKHSVFR